MRAIPMPFAASALPMMSTTRPTSAMSAGSATRTPTSANRGDLVALREEREGVSVVFTAIRGTRVVVRGLPARAG